MAPQHMGMRRVARGVGVEGVASVRGAVQELDPSCCMQPATVQDVPMGGSEEVEIRAGWCVSEEG